MVNLLIKLCITFIELIHELFISMSGLTKKVVRANLEAVSHKNKNVRTIQIANESLAGESTYKRSGLPAHATEVSVWRSV